MEALKRRKVATLLNNLPFDYRRLILNFFVLLKFEQHALIGFLCDGMLP